MKKWLKIVLWTIGSLILLMVLMMAGLMYKVKYGFPVTYETEAPDITIPTDQTAVLLFSKATGFPHTESIEAGKATFANLAEENDWFLYSTEEGGVFNKEQLPQFDAVIFNNCTGPLLNDEQRQVFQKYIENGGKYIGIHGAGDGSHPWQWYVDQLIGANFSHHSMDPQLQETQVTMTQDVDSLLAAGMASEWTHTDEWYVFFESPAEKGFNIIYEIAGEAIVTSGNFLWISDKDFGMGANHPVAWHRKVGEGQSFYTSMGHHGKVWEQEGFVRMLQRFVEVE